MQIRNNQGELTAEINTGVTENGDRIITNTLYDRGNPVTQNITVRAIREMFVRRTSSAGRF